MLRLVGLIVSTLTVISIIVNCGLFAKSRMDIAYDVRLKCGTLMKPSPLLMTQEFQPVNEDKLFVFSAFHDDRINVVRIFGIMSGKKMNVSLCQIWYEEQEEARVVELRLTILRDGHMKR